MSDTNRHSTDERLARLLKLAGPRPEPTARLRREVYEQVHTAWRAETRRRTGRRRLVQVALAASLAVVAVILVWPGRAPEPGPAAVVARLDRGALETDVAGAWQMRPAGDNLTGGVRVRTGAARAGLIMATGISVRLDRHTVIRLETPRRLSLDRGRLYVDTAARITRDAAIEVVTTGGIVRDIGTQFEVQVDAGTTQVRVRDGTVVLDTAGGDFQAGRGEALRLDVNGRIERTTVASTGASWQWVLEIAPGFDTDGRRVADLIDWAARESGLEVRYDDALTRNAAAAARIRGSVSGATPAQTLELALATTRFSYTIEDTVLIIEKH